MFKYEKEMIPIIKKCLQNEYNFEFVSEEFFSGNGIADLVCAKKIKASNLNNCDYENMSFIQQLFKSRKKKIPLSFLETFSLNKKKLRPLLQSLEQNGYISITNEYLIILKKYEATAEDFISIEAKLKDWKNGFYQALRYKCFSHKSYLALSETFIKNVDIELFKKHNIGLMSVRGNSIKIIHNPKKEKPSDQIAFLHLTDVFASLFFKTTPLKTL